jgi:small subunit ribosomal protein S17
MTDKKNKKTEEKTETKPVISKTFSGVVLSDKMDKTIVVKVDRTKIAPKLGKRYIVSSNYKVHDEKNQFKEGDHVTFVECRPLSKGKKWRVVYSK